jgi:tetratricopeptide (TPR) repeat protein
VTAADPVKAQNRIDLATDLLNHHQYGSAETEARKALDYDPGSAEAHRIIGLIHFARAKETVDLVEKADCLSGVDAEALRGEANDQVRTAEVSLRRAVELDPTFGEAWENLAATAAYFQNWDKVIELEEKALARLGRLTSESLARARLGWAFYQKQDYVRAAQHLLQATQGTGYFCLGNYYLASVYFARKEFEDAATRLKPVVDDPKYCPPMQEAQYLAGQALARLRDGATAQKAFQACVEMAPKSCQARQCEKALAELAP